jgi:hypothetical protein
MNYENLTKEELIAELKKLQLEKLQKSEHTIIHTPDGRYGWRAKREKEAHSILCCLPREIQKKIL